MSSAECLLLEPSDAELEASALGEIHFTDAGNAQRLCHIHGDRIRWCSDIGWYSFNGKHWDRVDDNVVVGLAKDVPISMLQQAAATEKEGLRRKLAEWAIESEAASALRAMASLVKSEPGIPISTDDLDADKWLLNVRNGTLDLRSGELLPHSPNDMITMIAGTDYDPGATAPTWEKYIESTMNEDTEMIGFLQRFCGYMLTGCTHEQCFAFLSGSGENGKGTLTETLSALMGSYASSISTAAIMVKAGDCIPHEWAGMRGKRLAFTGEVETSKTIDSALIKTLTGEDTMSVRFLRREFFQMKPVFKLMYSANGRPKVKDNSHGFWRRVRLIPFDVVFPKGDPRRISNLKDLLREELPGILNWCLTGLSQWRNKGLDEPDRVTNATQDYREGENVVKQFCDECLKSVPTHSIPLPQVHERFIAWAKSAGERQIGRNTFNAELRALGYDVKKRSFSLAVLNTAFIHNENNMEQSD